MAGRALAEAVAGAMAAQAAVHATDLQAALEQQGAQLAQEWAAADRRRSERGVAEAVGAAERRCRAEAQEAESRRESAFARELAAAKNRARVQAARAAALEEDLAELAAECGEDGEQSAEWAAAEALKARVAALEKAAHAAAAERDAERREWLEARAQVRPAACCSHFGTGCARGWLLPLLFQPLPCCALHYSLCCALRLRHSNSHLRRLRVPTGPALVGNSPLPRAQLQAALQEQEAGLAAQVEQAVCAAQCQAAARSAEEAGEQVVARAREAAEQRRQHATDLRRRSVELVELRGRMKEAAAATLEETVRRLEREHSRVS